MKRSGSRIMDTAEVRAIYWTTVVFTTRLTLVQRQRLVGPISCYIKGFNALINTLVVESKPRPSLTAHRVHNILGFQLGIGYPHCRLHQLHWQGLPSLQGGWLCIKTLLNAKADQLIWPAYLFVLTTVLILLGEQHITCVCLMVNLICDLIFCLTFQSK